jgi:hypothetical protein
MLKLFSSRYALVLTASLLLSGINAANAALITVDSQNVNQRKDLTITGFFGTPVFAGETRNFSAPAGATSFNNTWSDSISHDGVTAQGNSSIAYSFIGNQFLFSSDIATSHSGTSNADLAVIAKGGSTFNVVFTLNEAATVFYNLLGYTDNNGTGGSGGGSPFANITFDMFTGVFDWQGDKNYVRVIQGSTWDATVGNGAESFSHAGSALLEAGEYRVRSGTISQNMHFPRLSNEQSSAQSAGLDISLRFEEDKITDVSEPAALSMFALGVMGLAFRRYKR